MSEETQKTKAKKRGKHVALIVDDDVDFIVLASKLLTTLGFFVYTSNSPEDFLKKFNKHEPNFCMIDLKIGSATMGFTLLETLRIQLKSAIPIFVVSAENDAKITAHAIELGATDYIVKPVDPELLASKLSPYFSSEGISETRLPFAEVPKDQSSGTLNLDFELRSVDEMGVTLVSPHLITKGSVVQVKAAIFEQVTGKGDTHLVTVVNTWAEVGGESYAAYAEFDQSADGLLTGVRRWLLSRALVQKKD